LFAGAVERRGEANGVVVLTGIRTYFGRTTERVQPARPELHIEAVVGKVIRWFSRPPRLRLEPCFASTPRQPGQGDINITTSQRNCIKLIIKLKKI
jgi:magnesium-transporting ATPase (P-type)